MKDKASFNTERVKLEMMNLHNLRSNGSDKSLTKGDHKALDTNLLNEAIGPDQHQASDDEDSDLSDQSSKHDHHHQYSYTNQMIYDSIGASFHLDIFFRQLISHLFPPLAYLLVNFRAQGFMTMNFGHFFFNIASQFMLYVAFVAFFMSSAEEQKQLTGMPYITLIMLLQHKLMIALKYSSLSETEYARFQATTDEQRARRYLHQLDMLSGWSARDEGIILFELGCAAARIGAKIDEVYFSVADPNSSPAARVQFAHWNALMLGKAHVHLPAGDSWEFDTDDEGCELHSDDDDDHADDDDDDNSSSKQQHQLGVDSLSIQQSIRSKSIPSLAPQMVRRPDGSFEISVYDVALALQEAAQRKMQPVLQLEHWLVWGAVLLREVYPLVFSLVVFDLSRASPWFFVFLSFSCTLNILYGVTGLYLLLIAVWDSLRMLIVFRDIHHLIRLTDLTLESNFSWRVYAPSAIPSETAQAVGAAGTAGTAAMEGIAAAGAAVGIFESSKTAQKSSTKSREFLTLDIPSAGPGPGPGPSSVTAKTSTADVLSQRAEAQVQGIMEVTTPVARRASTTFRGSFRANSQGNAVNAGSMRSASLSSISPSSRASSTTAASGTAAYSPFVKTDASPSFRGKKVAYSQQLNDAFPDVQHQPTDHHKDEEKLNLSERQPELPGDLGPDVEGQEESAAPGAASIGIRKRRVAVEGITTQPRHNVDQGPAQLFQQPRLQTMPSNRKGASAARLGPRKSSFVDFSDYYSVPCHGLLSTLTSDDREEDHGPSVGIDTPFQCAANPNLYLNHSPDHPPGSDCDGDGDAGLDTWPAPRTNPAAAATAAAATAAATAATATAAASTLAARRFLQYGNKLHLQDGDPAHIPKLTLRSRENAVAWVYLRLVFQHFGDRFRLRADTYTGGVALLMLGIMVYKVVGFILAPDPLKSLSGGFFYQSLVLALTTWLTLIGLVGLGSIVNEELAVHSRTTWAHVLRLRDELFVRRRVACKNRTDFPSCAATAATAGSADHNSNTSVSASASPGVLNFRTIDSSGTQEHAQLREEREREREKEELVELLETVEFLESTTETLDHYTDLKPFKILGIKIYASTVATVVSTGISFVGILFSLITAEMQEQI